MDPNATHALVAHPLIWRACCSGGKEIPFRDIPLVTSQIYAVPD